MRRTPARKRRRRDLLQQEGTDAPRLPLAYLKAASTVEHVCRAPQAPASLGWSGRGNKCAALLARGTDTLRSAAVRGTDMPRGPASADGRQGQRKGTDAPRLPSPPRDAVSRGTDAPLSRREERIRRDRPRQAEQICRPPTPSFPAVPRAEQKGTDAPRLPASAAEQTCRGTNVPSPRRGIAEQICRALGSSLSGRPTSGSRRNKYAATSPAPPASPPGRPRSPACPSGCGRCGGSAAPGRICGGSSG